MVFLDNDYPFVDPKDAVVKIDYLKGKNEEFEKLKKLKKGIMSDGT